CSRRIFIDITIYSLVTILALMTPSSEDSTQPSSSFWHYIIPQKPFTTPQCHPPQLRKVNVMATPNPQNFSPEDLDRIIMMAWEDRTPFEAIYAQFGLTENQVIQLMRQIQPQKTFKRWRMRASGRKTKHNKLRPENVSRFKSDDQKF
ncbi:MAG: TIGR03643 family protein, partial [Deinococcota bacterium]